MNDTAPSARSAAASVGHYALALSLLAMSIGPDPARAQQPGTAAVVGVALPDVQRTRFVRAASATLIEANARLLARQKRASLESGDVKTKLDLDNATFRQDITAAEDRVADLKKAEAGRWTLLRHDVQTAIARVRTDMGNPAREPVDTARIP